MPTATSPAASSLGKTPYLTDFGLLDNPFRTTPSARYTYLTTSMKEAIAHSRHLVDSRRGLGAVTGDHGTGKTTLSRMFAEDARSDGNAIAYLPRVPGGARQTESKFYQAIAADLDLPAASGRSAERTLTGITEAAIRALRDRGKTVVVIVDEAHRLRAPGIAALMALLNMQTESDQLVQVLLFGQLPLSDVIRSDGAFHSRLAIHVTLNPLLLHDVKRMMTHRLHQAGREDPLFSDEALTMLYERSQGIPRRICMIADGACLRAWDESKSLVDKEHVIAAASALMHLGADEDDDAA